MRLSTLPALGVLAAMAISGLAHATSARQVFPELVGIHSVKLQLSLQNFRGADSKGLERAIRERLEAAGVGVSEAAPITLFVQATFTSSEICEAIAVQTHVAVSEDVKVNRRGRNPSVYLDTWSVDDIQVVSKGEAWAQVKDSLLGLVDYLIEAKKYSESVRK